MKKETAVNSKMLYEHFAGRSTPLEKNLIEEWLAMPENVEAYYQYLDEWEKANNQYLVNEQAAWSKLADKRAKEVDATSTKSNIFSLYKWAAAAIVILIVGGALFATKDYILNKTIATVYGEVKQITLPDGSVVTLNANSSISYSRFFFSKQTREVSLKGEADFSVVHTKSNQPFLVKTSNNLNVTVLGTQFSVYARDAKANVVLRNGKVALSYNEQNHQKSLVLKPGDSFTQNNKIGVGIIEHITNTEDVVAWKKHDFLFETTPLSEVAALVKDDFGINMQFQNSALAARKISGSFHADTVEELIDAIAQVLDVNYKAKNDSILFFE